MYKLYYLSFTLKNKCCENKSAVSSPKDIHGAITTQNLKCLTYRLQICSDNDSELFPSTHAVPLKQGRE